MMFLYDFYKKLYRCLTCEVLKKLRKILYNTGIVPHSNNVQVSDTTMLNQALMYGQ